MINEWRLFLVALQFLTRFRRRGWSDCPRIGSPGRGSISRSSAPSSAAFRPSRCWERTPSGARPRCRCLIALATGLVLTGALHEDGLADTADGLGGGRSPQQRRAIMKDPRLGAYGALTLGFVLAIKAAALCALPFGLAAAGLVCAHAGARAAVVWTMSFLPYAAEPTAAKVTAAHRTLGGWELALTLAFALAPVLLLIRIAAGLACVGAATLSAILLAAASAKRIGGHTGDVLGAVEQVYELVFLLVLSALSAAGRLG